MQASSVVGSLPNEQVREMARAVLCNSYVMLVGNE